MYIMRNKDKNNSFQINQSDPRFFSTNTMNNCMWIVFKRIKKID